MRSPRLALGTFIAALFGCGLPVQAALIAITGNENGADATATADSAFDGTTLTVTITNTSPFDALITGIGYDLPPVGNASPSGLDGFDGDITVANSLFVFNDGDLGNVPQFNDAVIDFGFLAGGAFNNGTPGASLHPGFSETYTVTGPFDGLSEAEIVGSIFVRFQRVGEDGEGSDVGHAAPEPSSLLLASLGLTGAWGMVRRRRMRPAA